MSSFFTVPGSHKKRKRPSAPDIPKKKVAAPRFSGKKSSAKPSAPAKRRVERRQPSDSDNDDDDDDDDGLDDDDDESGGSLSDARSAADRSESDDEGETAAEKRLRLAERYLENVREHVDEAGFDAADIDRDLIAERLQEDVAEGKGRVYRQLASELALGRASQTLYRTNTGAVTSVAACAPFFYTATKDLHLHKWRAQESPQQQQQQQQQQTTRRRPRRPPAPARTRPELVSWTRGSRGKGRDKAYQRHVGPILAVAASPDGRYVVTGGADRRLIVHDAATLRPLRVWTHHRDAVTGLAFRRGTNQLYSSSRDRTVKVWSLDELAYVETLFGHQDGVVDVDALAQERCVSVGARDRTARLWKVAEETQLVFRGGGGGDKKRPAVVDDPRSLAHEGSMDRIAMIDDDLFVTGSDNGAIALWSVQKKKPVHVEPLAHGLDPPLDPAQASAERDPDPDRVVPPPQPRWITALRTVPYSDLILSGSWDGLIRVWRLADDRRSIEPVGALGGAPPSTTSSSPPPSSSSSSSSTSPPPQRPIRGIVNDIAVFERGERGTDGLCVVAAVAAEHRLGRWKVCRGARNGGVVFEVPRAAPPVVNGADHSSGGEED